MAMIFAEQDKEHFPTHIIRDRDTKFTKQFCDILKSEGIEFREIAPLSPNMNPFTTIFHSALEIPMAVSAEVLDCAKPRVISATPTRAGKARPSERGRTVPKPVARQTHRKAPFLTQEAGDGRKAVQHRQVPSNPAGAAQ